MDSQETTNNADPISGRAPNMVKPNAPLPANFQARPQGQPPTQRPLSNGPLGGPRPGAPPHLLRRLDSRTSLGPPGPGQNVQLRPYGPRPPGGSFPRGQNPQNQNQNPQSPQNPQNFRFPQTQGVRAGQGPRPFYQGQPRDEQRVQRVTFDPSIPQNGQSFQRRPEGPRPGQDQRPILQRNESSLNLHRQNSSAAIDDKQSARPRIVIGKMADIEENQRSDSAQSRKQDFRENGENDDDDDDVVMDSEKTPRSNGNADVDLSKSPQMMKKSEESVKQISRPGTATIDKPDVKGIDILSKVESKIIKDVIDLKNKVDAEIKDLKDPKDVKDSNEVKDNKDADEVPDKPADKAESKEEASIKVEDKKTEDSNVEDVQIKPEENAKIESVTRPATATIDPNPEDPPKVSAPEKIESTFEEKEDKEKEDKTEEKEDKSSKDTVDFSLLNVDKAKEEAKSPASPASPALSTHSTVHDETEKTTSECSVIENTVEKLESAALKSQTAKTPPKTPDKSSSEPAQPDRPSENPHRDKVDESFKENEPPPDANESESKPPSAEKLPEAKPSVGTLDLNASLPDKKPTTPEKQNLKVPTSETPPKSPEGSVKGFDNGQRRSLSSRSSPCYSPKSPKSLKSPKSPKSPNSPKSPKSPKSPVVESKPTEEKKKTTFADDAIKEDEKDDVKSHKAETGSRTSKPTTPTGKPRRPQTPAKMKDSSPTSAEVQNGTGTNESSQDNAIPTTNGVAEALKKSPSKSKDSDKRSTAGSPTKSPSKSSKSLPRTPETPSSTTGEKKIPMNKVQVGAAPSPNLKTVRSKIGSLDNASYKPGGGKVKIENRKLDFSKAQPKIAAKNEKYTPSGGDKKIAQVKLQWNAKPKVGSLDNATYKPGGGDKKIETVKLDFKDKAKPKVGSKDNAKHVPGGGSVKSSTSPPKTPQDANNDIQTQKVDIKAESKVGSLNNVKHKPGGGDKKIFNDRDYLRQAGSNVESLSGSGSQVQTPNGEERPEETPKDVDLPQPPPSTPTKSRAGSGSSSAVTPRAVRNSLAKTPDATTPKRGFPPKSEKADSPAPSPEEPKKKSPTPEETDEKQPAKSLKSPTAESSEKHPPKSPKSPKSPVTDADKRVKPSRSPNSPRPPTSLRLKTPDKSADAPRKGSPKQLRLPKLAPSPVQENNTPITTSPKITLPKLIEPASQSTRVAH